jgi:hypothetical protein
MRCRTGLHTNRRNVLAFFQKVPSCLVHSIKSGHALVYAEEQKKSEGADGSMSCSDQRASM